MSDTQEQPTPGQDQVAPDPTPAAPAAPAAPIPAPSGAGPWADDLNALFTDEGIRGTVDTYLRTKVQPRMTQLEQQAAQSADAQRLWQNFNENPIDTYVQVTTEMFGEEAGQALLGAIQSSLEAQESQLQQPAPGYEQQPPTDPRVAEAVSYYENQRAAEAYQTELDKVKEYHSGQGLGDINERLFGAMVNAAGGDFNTAYQMYNQAIEELNPPAPAEEAAQVLGSDTATTTPSSTETLPRKETLGDAIEGFVKEQRASREAPPVGTV